METDAGDEGDQRTRSSGERAAAGPLTAGETLTAAEVSGLAFGELAPALVGQRLPQLDPLALALDLALSRAAGAHVLMSEGTVHRAYGWSWSGFRILFMLWLFDQAEARDLARLTGGSRQATSTVLATLERKGLVSRERVSGRDRRLVAVRLTRQGRRLVEQAFAEQNRLDAEWFGCLTEVEQQHLLDLLQRLTARIAASGRTRTHGRADRAGPP